MGIFQSDNYDSIHNRARKDYFGLIQKIQTTAYLTNSHKSSNISISLVEKTFDYETSTKKKTFGASTRKTKTDWKGHLKDYLRTQLSHSNNWASRVLRYVQSESFFYANEFKNSLFLFEFELNTKPKCLINPNSSKKDSKMDMASLTDSLGGSFISSNTDYLLPNDPAIEYRAIRDTVKAYINKFKEQIFESNHPINKIVTKFVEVILDEMQAKLERIAVFKNEIELSKVVNENTSTKQYIQIIQGFILQMQTALKLFYAKTLNYDCMREEKDEFVSLICCLLFQVREGQLYHQLFEYYKMNLTDKIALFEEKMKEMNVITLKELGIKEQFRLDDSTLKYMKFLIKDKSLHLGNDKDSIDKANHLKDLEEKISHVMGLKTKPLAYDKEIGHEDDNGDEYLELGYSGNYNSVDQPQKELQFFKRLGSLNEENEINISNRKRNNSIFSIKTKSINGMKINFDEPYHSAIELFKSIKNYYLPFQKMLICGNLSLEITKCINEYWDGMESVTPPDLLNIDADELLSIFIYIIIKANISEIFIHQQFIADFTPLTTKKTMIGYYYTTVESALLYLTTTKTKQNLCDKRRRSSIIPDRSSFSNEF